ncbi:MAG: KpsF/GutQ family sugar-phosphate isomerase, partial [Planctomycetota bacterium]
MPESLPMTARTPHADPSDSAFVRTVLEAESDAIRQGASALEDDAIDRALDLICACAQGPGSLLVSGMGKSGLVGAKLSATFTSLGVASHTVHPAEAVHGDLGKFQPDDCLLALSFSGETEELVALAGLVRQDDLPIVAITGGDGSSALARLASVALPLGAIREASDVTLAPTSSTTATMALGDALALAAARRLRVDATDFAKHHPGGALGGLMRPVTDALRFRVDDNLPLVRTGTTLLTALTHADSLGRRPGAMLIVDAQDRLVGIFTDGDLRRLVSDDPQRLGDPIDNAMTTSPRTLPDTALVRDAVRLVREHRQDEIPVVDPTGAPVRLLDVHDLLAMRGVA